MTRFLDRGTRPTRIESPVPGSSMIAGAAPIIEVNGLRKSFDETEALAGVDLTSEAGHVMAMLGPNGAGKTTLVRILSTLLRPDAGWARVAGYDVVRNTAALRKVLGLTGRFAALDDFLTGRENLEMLGELYHLSDATPAYGQRTCSRTCRLIADAAVCTLACVAGEALALPARRGFEDGGARQTRCLRRGRGPRRRDVPPTVGGTCWRSAVASQPAETRDRFSSPSRPQVRRRSSSPLIPVCQTAISVAPASKYCSIAAASASSSPITASSAGCETPSSASAVVTDGTVR